MGGCVIHAAVWTVLAMVLAIVGPAAADVSVSGGRVYGIVVDGFPEDWNGIPGTTFTLIRPLSTTERMANGLTLKVAYDDANIYVLVLIADDFNYNATDHFLSSSLAVLWQIDAAATPDMGGGLGNVDIWHWELDTGPGVPAGGPDYANGNDPSGNFDDEWSSSPTNRRDDTDANELYGVWSHTNMSAPDAPGTWVFEMRRTLRTGDTFNQDRQFTVNQSVGMSVAYWDADETPLGWTPAGHFATCTDPATLGFSWIRLTLVPVPLPQGPAGPPGPTGGQGPTGSQGNQGVEGPTSSVLVGASYGALGLGILGVLLGAVALARSRRRGGPEKPS